MKITELRLPIGVLIGAVVGVLAASPAAAASPPAPYVLDYPYPTSESVIQEYGGVPPASRQPIAATTTVFDIRFDFPQSQFTPCQLTDAAGVRLVSQELPISEEDPNRVYLFPIRAGTITAGQNYDIRCQTGYYGERGATWHLVASSTLAGSTTILEPNPAALQRVVETQSYFRDSGAEEGIVPGEAVRVVSAVGTWTPPGESDGLSITLKPDVGSAEPVSVPGTASTDGSTVDFRMPDTLAFGYADGVYISMIAAGTTAATVMAPETVHVRTLSVSTLPYVEPPATVTSSTALSLSSSRVALTKARATVRVAVSDGSAPIGEVVVYGDGRAISRATIGPLDGGSVVITLPRLSRGSHAITAEFHPSGSALPSTSVAKRLRQVI